MKQTIHQRNATAVPTAVRTEFHLTLAVRRDCECAPYFIRRRAVLLPAVVEHAERVGVDPVDDFARYARGVHRRHLDGLSLAVTR